jgi:hypothetical protein
MLFIINGIAGIICTAFSASGRAESTACGHAATLLLQSAKRLPARKSGRISNRSFPILPDGGDDGFFLLRIASRCLPPGEKSRLDNGAATQTGARQVLPPGPGTEFRSRLILRSTSAQGRIARMPVNAQKSTSAGRRSLPYPRQAYSLVQCSRSASMSQ